MKTKKHKKQVIKQVKKMNLDELYILERRIFEIEHASEFQEIARAIQEGKKDKAGELMERMQSEYGDIAQGELQKMLVLIARRGAIGK